MTRFTLDVAGMQTIGGNIDLTAPPPPPTPEPYRVLKVPETGKFMRLLDDWDTPQWNFMPRSRYKNYKSDPPWNALPATIPTDDIFQRLDRAWQFFYRDLMRRNVPESVMSNEELLDAYTSTTRDAGGWRDRHTWNDVKNVPPHLHTDHVLGLNPSSPYGDAAQKDLWSSGNIVKVIGATVDYYLVEALDTKLPPPPVDEVWGKWWLVGFLTLSAYNWQTEERARLKWPFFKGYGCPHMALARNGIGRIPRYWCRPIENGATYSPYNP